MLNVKNTRLWIKALRSGEFKPTWGFLRKDTGASTYTHCCLGIVCELYSSSVGGFFDANNAFVYDFSTGKNDYSEHEGFKFSELSDTQFLASPLLKWIGLNSKIQFALAEANDNGVSFNYIADVLSRALTYQKKYNKVPVESWWYDELNSYHQGQLTL